MMKQMLVAIGIGMLVAQPAIGQSPPTRKSQAAQGRFSIDTPIAKLMADAQARAALTKVMPILAASPHLKQFEHLSIRELATNPHVVLDNAKIRTLQTELAKIK